MSEDESALDLKKLAGKTFLRLGEPGRWHQGQHIILRALQQALDAKLEAMAEEQRRVLRNVVYQFAYWSDKGNGGLCTGGLSALEEAFEALGWDDPHPAAELACDDDGCVRRANCGTRTLGGYRWTCGEHRPKNERGTVQGGG